MQLRIIAQIVQLRERDRIVWPPKPAEKKKPAAAKRRPAKKVLDQQARIAKSAKKTLGEMSYEEIDQLLLDMADTTRREGILALNQTGEEAVDGYVGMAVKLVVDGTEPALIVDMMKTWMRSLMHEHEVKYQKVIEGMLSIQAGDNPRVVEHKVSLIY